MEHFDWFNYVILPIIIGLARIFDVTVGTLRIIFVSKGKKTLAPLLGFVEVLAWIIVIGEIMKSANNFACYIGYALGFAAGNYIGMLIEEKLAIGNLIVRVIVDENQRKLKDEIVKAGFGMTIVPAFGAMGHPVDVLFMAINRSNLNQLVEIIKNNAPSAFYSVEEAKYVKEGFYPSPNTNYKKFGFDRIIYFWRKGK
ncbi:MAG: DUF2179 domain-containing protein [Bacteroidales bacterium]|nr:DUF2179 domain-containing protein [Bacteroidales bacterium]